MEYISSDIRNKNFIVDKIQDIPVELYTKTSPTKRWYDIFMAPSELKIGKIVQK